MANRNFPSQRLFSFHMLPVSITGSFAVGASGAPTLSTASKGVASITRNSAGNYTITLQDGYFAINHASFQAKAVNATTPSGIGAIEIVGNAIATQGGGTVNLVCFASGAAADPTSGSSIFFQLILNNSSVQ